MEPGGGAGRDVSVRYTGRGGGGRRREKKEKKILLRVWTKRVPTPPQEVPYAQGYIVARRFPARQVCDARVNADGCFGEARGSFASLPPHKPRSEEQVIVVAGGTMASPQSPSRRVAHWPHRKVHQAGGSLAKPRKSTKAGWHTAQPRKSNKAGGTLPNREVHPFVLQYSMVLQ